jgi:hypothetical protein
MGITGITFGKTYLKFGKHTWMPFVAFGKGMTSIILLEVTGSLTSIYCIYKPSSATYEDGTFRVPDEPSTSEQISREYSRFRPTLQDALWNSATKIGDRINTATKTQ